MMLPLVLLPGMMCDSRLFLHQVKALGNNRQITVGNITTEDQISSLAASVLESCPPRFMLAGLSMGGIVAMEMIAQAPERIAGLALLDTNPLAETPERKALRAPQVERARNGALSEIMQNELKPQYLADGPQKPEILRLCMKMALNLGSEVFARQSFALRDRPDQCKTLQGVNVPTLILCGREDKLCPVERHEMMQGLIKGAELQVIEKAGHLPTLEQPEATNAALARWLGSE